MRDAELRSVPVSTGPARSTRSRVRYHPELQGSHTRRMRDTYVQYLHMSRSRKVEIEAPAAVRTNFGRNWRSS